MNLTTKRTGLEKLKKEEIKNAHTHQRLNFTVLAYVVKTLYRSSYQYFNSFSNAKLSLTYKELD